MTTLPVLTDVRDILVSVLGLQPPRDDLEADTALFGSMPDLDSLALVELITVIEERFGFVMDEEDVSFEVFETVGARSQTTSTGGSDRVAEPADEHGLSVLVPAHNEGSVIARLLDRLAPTGAAREAFEVVVVCNGCTDDTAEVARSYAPGVRVLEIPEPSKAAAMRRGDAASVFAARAYVDADIVIGADDLEKMHRQAIDRGWLAVAPRRVLDLDRSPRTVRWYYDVWSSLPQVRSGLFGRGVVLVTAEGRARLDTVPDVLSDDLVRSEAFGSDERGVCDDASVTVDVPRSLGALVRRRSRVVRGNTEADGLGLRSDATRTSLRVLAAVVARQPSLVPKLPVFVGVTVAARWREARTRGGGAPVWERDETTR